MLSTHVNCFLKNFEKAFAHTHQSISFFEIEEETGADNIELNKIN